MASPRLDCMTGHVEDSLRNLDEAIKLNPAVRFQARNDSDFQNLSEDPRFTELLYPGSRELRPNPSRPSRKKRLTRPIPWNPSSGRTRYPGRIPPMAAPLRVVAIGGGTGLSTLLKGLKNFVPAPGEAFRPTTGQPVISELSAIVTVSDDGGSSGRLRKELNMLPPGDIRNCIVALSEDADLLSQLFRHRFEKGPASKATASAIFFWQP